MPARTARRDASRAEASRTEPTPPATSWTEGACQLAGLAVPLAFHTLGTVAFESTKVLLLRVLALVLIAGWIGAEAGRIGQTPGPFAWRGALLRVWHGPLRLVALGALGVILTTVLATAISLTPLVSLLGSWDRQQGLATTVAWVTLGVAAALAGRDPKRRRGLLLVWALGSAPVCVYAFVQQANLDPISWLNVQLGVGSTLGSSTALATYLAMLVPLTVACAVLAATEVAGVALDGARPTRRRGGWKALLSDPRIRYGGLISILVMQVAALAMTQVRGGLLGLAVALVAMVGFALWPTHRRLVLLGGAAALVVLVVGSGLLAAVPRPDVGDGADTSARQRLLIWQGALSALTGPRFLSGHGPETQILALEPHYPVELALRFENARYDRAHNLLLDTLLTTGLLGLAALVVMVAGVVRAAFLGYEREPGAHGGEWWLVGGLLGALAANLTAGQFAFDTAATGALFWMVCGLLIAPLVPAAPAAAPEPVPKLTARQRREQQQDRLRGLTPPVRLRATAMLAAGAIALATVPWLTAHFLADLYHTEALALRAGEAPASSTRRALAAAQSVPWLDVPLLALADTFLDIARTSTLTSSATITTFEDLFETVPSSRAALFDAARVTLERAVQINPLDPYTHVALARYAMLRAEASRDPAEQAQLYQTAVEAYDRAIEAGPSRVAFYDEAGVALTRWGRPSLAMGRFAQAEALSRPTAERLTRVADATLVAGDVAGARALYEQALTLDNESSPAEAGLARLDRAAGDLASALEHAQRAARLSMRNWEYQRDLALTLRDLGQREEALEAARAARRLAPAWEQDELTALIDSVSG